MSDLSTRPSIETFVIDSILLFEFDWKNLTVKVSLLFGTDEYSEYLDIDNENPGELELLGLRLSEMSKQSREANK
jgi:hypothetical protein